MHRPAPAIIISGIALLFVMSGTAVAATGGSFILGKPNTAGAVTSLSNPSGTALSLSSSSTTPPLSVANKVQVPNLNASLLGGKPASAFLGAKAEAANSAKLGGQPPSAYLGATGTAANASQLGGQPASSYLTTTGTVANAYALGGQPSGSYVPAVGGTAGNSAELGGIGPSGFIQGGGTISDARVINVSGAGNTVVGFLSAPGSGLAYDCVGSEAQPQLWISGNSYLNETATWWNKDGVGQQQNIQHSEIPIYGAPGGTTGEVVQVDGSTAAGGSNISTYTATASYNSSTNTCNFTAQVVTSNG